MVAKVTMAIPNLDSLQGVLDNINISTSQGKSSVNVYTDALSDKQDDYWRITPNATIIMTLAGGESGNDFGIFNQNDPSKYIEIFNGSASAGAQATLSIKPDGSVHINHVDTGIDFFRFNFGYYLDSTDNTGGGFWYSDITLNADNADHMFAYRVTNHDTIQLPNLPPGLRTNQKFVLAFEDLHSLVSDYDYDDFIVTVNYVNQVPEPSTIFLIAGLVCVMLGINRKRFMI